MSERGVYIIKVTDTETGEVTYSPVFNSVVVETDRVVGVCETRGNLNFYRLVSFIEVIPLGASDKADIYPPCSGEK